MKPLVRRKRGSKDWDLFKKSVERLEGMILNHELSQKLEDILKAVEKEYPRNLYNKPELVVQLVTVWRTMYKARLMSAAEYYHRINWEAEMVLEQRKDSGKYKEKLGPLEVKMTQMLKAGGLENDYWPDEVPVEYQALERQWEAVLNQERINILNELGMIDLIDMEQHDSVKLKILLERGRRSVADRDDYVGALNDIVVQYEKDANSAAAVKAYSAAITSLGAGAEGLLLLRCMKSNEKACSIAKKINKRTMRFRNLADPTTWTFEQLIAVCSDANWLPVVKGKRDYYHTAIFVDMLRKMRNYVHPGKLARERTWLEVEERQYLDAEAIYRILLTIVEKGKRGIPKDITLMRIKHFIDQDRG